MMNLQAELSPKYISPPRPAAGVPSTPSATAESLDILGDILEAVHLRTTVTGPTAFTVPWEIQVVGGSPRFYLVTQGACSLVLEGGKSVVTLSGGDLAVVIRGSTHCLCGGLDPLKSVDGSVRETANLPPPRTTLVMGEFVLDSPGFCPFLSTLPLLILVKGVQHQPVPWLNDLVRVMIRESNSAQPGSQTILNRLVHVLFIQAIRAYVATLPKAQGEGFAALLDPEIGRAVRLMHLHPEKPWTVAALAEKICMSRSAFAARFSALVGHSPLYYLFLCRMNKACELLRDPQKGIKDIAARVGYASEAAFSNAFKRWSGWAPGNYRIGMQEEVKGS